MRETIHLAQLPPFKPHSVATSIQREVAGEASDMEIESVLLKPGEALGFLEKTSEVLQVFAKTGFSAQITLTPMPG